MGRVTNPLCFYLRKQLTIAVKVKVWGVTDSIVHTFSAHSKAISDMCIFRRGCYLLTASLDKAVRLWNTKTFEQMQYIKVKEEPISIGLMEGKDIYICAGSEVSIWSVEDITQVYMETEYA
jgi:WD40 repeat protein